VPLKSAAEEGRGAGGLVVPRKSTAEEGREAGGHACAGDERPLEGRAPLRVTDEHCRGRARDGQAAPPGNPCEQARRRRERGAWVGENR
jgi:hypothetical protein